MNKLKWAARTNDIYIEWVGQTKETQMMCAVNKYHEVWPKEHTHILIVVEES